MNIYQAIELMKNKKSVESLVSFTMYEMSKEGLLAEGILVPFEYLTPKEINGEWREVEVIEREEDFSNLSSEQKEQILVDAMKHYKFINEHKSDMP
ncbi:hypothetical protein C4A75_09505 [Brevibacillus laterosporus]|uniref:Uncharacterized protein n=1 Tax=Brevibacillus laterosporus TaxID=1465 RepID=A0AAP8QGR2_BRELA|nr:hypothetical protein [Brevibacillus laterosporus]PPA85003.1 hypothetical protein C4A75_09505 [Brevibacillus laterosporus]PPB12897.1 hypothetical protein C4A77_00490 [Brevibacillus laterosporus]